MLSVYSVKCNVEVEGRSLPERTIQISALALKPPLKNETQNVKQGGQQTLEDPENLGFCLALEKYPGNP